MFKMQDGFYDEFKNNFNGLTNRGSSLVSPFPQTFAALASRAVY